MSSIILGCSRSLYWFSLEAGVHVKLSDEDIIFLEEPYKAQSVIGHTWSGPTLHALAFCGLYYGCGIQLNTDEIYCSNCLFQTSVPSFGCPHLKVITDLCIRVVYGQYCSTTVPMFQEGGGHLLLLNTIRHMVAPSLIARNLVRYGAFYIGVLSGSCLDEAMTTTVNEPITVRLSDVENHPVFQPLRWRNWVESNPFCVEISSFMAIEKRIKIIWFLEKNTS